MAAGLGLVLLVLLLLVGAVVAVLVVTLTVTHGRSVVPSEAARAAVRHGAVVHGIALAALLVALVAVPSLAEVADGPAGGVVLGLTPAFAGVAFAAVQAWGEVTWRRPTGRVRRAPLTRRTVADVAPRWLRAAAWGWTALTAAVLLACGPAAAADGRSIERAWAAGGAASGPFPGWYFGVPLLVAVVVVVLAAEGVLRLVAARPTVADADPAWDLSLRRLSAHRVLRGAQLVPAWTAAGVLWVAGMALRNLGSAATDTVPASTVHLALATVALVLAAVAAIGGAVLALVPAAPATAATPARAEAGDRDPAPA